MNANPSLSEPASRLMVLLHGETVSKPPLWEVWFAKGQMMKDRYAGDPFALAKDLGHAAWCLGSAPLGVDFVNHQKVEDSIAYYAGGTLRDIKQLLDAPMPDFAARAEKLQPYRAALREHGLACWLILPWCFDRLSAWMGLENFAMAFYDQPDFVHDACKWIEDRNQAAVELMVKTLMPDIVLYNGDCAYKNGPMVQPRMIRDFCQGPSQQTVDAVKALDIPFTFHTDGQLDAIIPILLDLGIVAVHGCEKQANDLEHLVATFGRDIVLVGNMDVVFLTHSSEEEIRRETHEMLRVGSRYGKFIAACNTSPQDYIPDEHYIAMCRAIQDYTGDGSVI